ISGEHGIGLDKREAMRWLFTRETLSFFRRLKHEFDAENLCNPDKLLPLVSKSASADKPDAAVKAVESSALGETAPNNEKDLVHIIKDAVASKTLLGIQGSGTKYHVKESVIIQTTNFNQILDFDKGNLTLTVQAGALVQDMKAETEKSGQYLWIAGTGT